MTSNALTRRAKASRIKIPVLDLNPRILDRSVSCVGTRLECDEARVAPECKSEIPLMNGPCSSMVFLAYTVGVRAVGTRLECEPGRSATVA